jgi:hypothetical protein
MVDVLLKKNKLFIIDAVGKLYDFEIDIGRIQRSTTICLRFACVNEGADSYELITEYS